MLADRADTFTSYRPLLFSIAYRMLGTVMDAEDILQETFLRWQRASVEEVENPRAYLSAVVTRLCIDQLRSARVQREEYIGPWLPEPLFMTEPAPIESTILAETLSTAFLVLLENLNPVERAVYLLREVFDYGYAEIAKIVDKTEDNCRQLFSRAKKYITQRRPLAPAGLEIRLARVNGLPGAVYYVNGIASGVFAFQMVAGRGQNIFAVLNPEKLGNVRFHSLKG